ncbi:MAG: dTMP kinase [Pseudomonadota bacterium]
MIGKFITFEGGEGCGKSTQVSHLIQFLRIKGIKALPTREPGGSPGAELIRGLHVTGEIDRWDAMTETLLLFAARRDHLVRTILPALQSGTWVICDRYVDSTMAYQGYGRGVDHATIDALHKMVAGDLRPDLTLVLDIDPEIGLKRTFEREHGLEDRFERMDMNFHRRLRAGFLEIAKQDPSRYAIVDAGRAIDDVALEIEKQINERFAL